MNNLTPHTISEKFVERDHPQLSLWEQSRLLGVSYSSLYYQPKPVSEEDLDLLNRIDKIHTDWPTFGSRKIAKELTKQFQKEKSGLVVGRKRAKTLMEQMGIEAIYPQPNLSLNTLPHKVYPYLLNGLTISYPNQVWGSDVTYIKMHGGYLYLVAIMDWHSRFIVAHKLSTTLETEFCLSAAKEALKVATPGIINTDQGVQFTNDNFTGLWDPRRTKISMDHKGRCFDNIFTERFWRSFKYEEVYLKDYQSVREAEQSIRDYIRRYNFERIHQALDYKTPAEVYLKDQILWEGSSRRLFVN